MTGHLSPEDQARVDRVLARGIYSVDRPPFKAWRLFWVVVLVLTALSFTSYLIAWWYKVV